MDATKDTYEIEERAATGLLRAETRAELPDRVVEMRAGIRRLVRQNRDYLFLRARIQASYISRRSSTCARSRGVLTDCCWPSLAPFLFLLEHFAK